MTGPARDRRRTDVADGRAVTFVQLGPDFVPPFEQVTSVSVVPFADDGRSVAALLRRGVDLPGGHVQEGETSVEQVARREAMEEAGIGLRDIRVVLVIQSDYYGTAPEDLTYMVMVAARVDAYHKFAPNEESSGRVVLDGEEFLRRYTAGDTEAMRRITAAARTALDSTP